MSEAMLDRDRFRAWLEAKPAGELVGYARDTRAFPLSWFLEDQGLLDAEVVWGWWRWQARSSTWPCPRWARLFEEFARTQARPTLTAAHCLQLLALVPEAACEEDRDE